MNTKRIMITGSSGSGKSTFARKFMEILRFPEWIIDGNYQRTIDIRMKKADTIILFDLPTEVCLEGAIARIGAKREDRQWVEIYALLDNYREKDIVIFKSREEADKYAQYYGTSENAN